MSEQNQYLYDFGPFRLDAQKRLLLRKGEIVPRRSLRHLAPTSQRSQPRRLTDLKSAQIIAFDWSRDGRSLAFIRNVATSDVVLIANAASD